jgi:transposase-like protein
MPEKTETKKGKRYTADEKQQVLEYVAEVNRKQKRGGQKAAAEKFGISPLTISNWLKAAKKKGPAKKATPKVAKKKMAGRKSTGRKATKRRGRPAKKAAQRGRPAGSGMTAKLRKLSELNDQIGKAEAHLGKLKKAFAKLKQSL